MKGDCLLIVHLHREGMLRFGDDLALQRFAAGPHAELHALAQLPLRFSVQLVIVAARVALGDAGTDQLGIGRRALCRNVMRAQALGLALGPTRCATLAGVTAADFQRVVLAALPLAGAVQCHHVVRDLLGITGGPENLVLVFLQDLDPALHVGRMLAGIVGHAQLVGHEVAGQLGAQLFFGVLDRTERPTELAPQALFVAGPVAQLMQGRGVVGRLVLELIAGGKVDLILRWAVKRPVRLIVVDLRARRLQDGLGPFVGVPLVHARSLRQLGHVVHLLGIENDRTEDLRLFKHDLDHLGLAILAHDRLAFGVQLGLLVRILPVFDQRTLLALADLPALRIGLLVRGPSRIAVALLHRHGRQIQAVRPAIGLLRGRVVGKPVGPFAGVPRLLPGGSPGLKLFNQLVGQYLPVVFGFGHALPPSLRFSAQGFGRRFVLIASRRQGIGFGQRVLAERAHRFSFRRRQRTGDFINIGLHCVFSFGVNGFNRRRRNPAARSRCKAR